MPSLLDPPTTADGARTVPQLRPGLPPLPPGIAQLPIDPRGYPVPWFVHQPPNKPADFRIIGRGKLELALRAGLCWICGDQLFPKAHCFVIGPMCLANRLASEPPSHPACAAFAVAACPHLADPAAQRRPIDQPTIDPPGVMLTHNPGAVVLWRTVADAWEIEHHLRGPLLRLKRDPRALEVWTQGRRASRAEAMAALDRGLARLERLALEDLTPGAMLEFARMGDRAQRLLQAAYD